MPDMGHMHADLMRSPRLQATLEKTSKGKAFNDAEIGYRIAAVCDHRHIFAIFRVAVYRGLNPATLFPAHSPYQRQIAAFDFARLLSLRQRPVRNVVLGYDKQTTSILVESMHNPRSQYAVDARQIATMVQ